MLQGVQMNRHSRREAIKKPDQNAAPRAYSLIRQKKKPTFFFFCFKHTKEN